jgi:hypothetical protein
MVSKHTSFSTMPGPAQPPITTKLFSSSLINDCPYLGDGEVLKNFEFTHLQGVPKKPLFGHFLAINFQKIFFSKMTQVVFLCEKSIVRIEKI